LVELEEEWVIPVDLAFEGAGGHVFKAEIKELEAEASHASGAAKTKLQPKLAAAKASLDGAVHRARRRVDTLKQEADAKAESLELQPSQVKGDVKDRIKDRMKRVKNAYHARGAKLAQAWNLTKEALTA